MSIELHSKETVCGFCRSGIIWIEETNGSFIITASRSLLGLRDEESHTTATAPSGRVVIIWKVKDVLKDMKALLEKKGMGSLYTILPRFEESWEALMPNAGVSQMVELV